MSDPNAPSGVNATGGVSPEQLKTLQDAILSTLRSDVNAAITTRMGGRDALEELKATVQSLADRVQAQAPAGNKQPSKAAGNGTNQGEELEAQLQEMRTTLQASQAELLRERKTAALRSALSKSGVRVESQEDALRLLSLRDDLKPSKDANGDMVWQGQVAGQLGDRVTAGLEDVVKEFVSERRYMMPPSGAGGSGALGGSNGPLAGVGKPLDQMTEQEINNLPPETLNQLWTDGGGGTSSGGFFGPT